MTVVTGLCLLPTAQKHEPTFDSCLEPVWKNQECVIPPGLTLLNFVNTILPSNVLWSAPFSYHAPVIWNQLPVSVRHSTSVSSFKSSLKTFLFLKTFSSVSLPWYATGVCVCVCVCVCVRVRARVCVCVRAHADESNFLVHLYKLQEKISSSTTHTHTHTHTHKQEPQTTTTATTATKSTYPVTHLLIP